MTPKSKDTIGSGKSGNELECKDDHRCCVVDHSRGTVHLMISISAGVCSCITSTMPAVSSSTAFHYHINCFVRFVLVIQPKRCIKSPMGITTVLNGKTPIGTKIMSNLQS